jgi:hypothetical protein
MLSYFKSTSFRESSPRIVLAGLKLTFFYSKQATCSAADFRHLCAAFDSNRQLLLQKVNQELEREQPDVKMRKKLEKERDDLNNHVSLVWVRLDDVHEDQMGHPPHIRYSLCSC